MLIHWHLTAIEIRIWMSDGNPQETMYVITYPCPYLRQAMQDRFL